jgi:hypothetical protein
LAGRFFNVLATFSGDAEFAFVPRDKCKVFFLRNCAFGFLRLISISIVYALMIGLTRLKLQDGVFAGPNPDVENHNRKAIRTTSVPTMRDVSPVGGDHAAQRASWTRTPFAANAKTGRRFKDDSFATQCPLLHVM